MKKNWHKDDLFNLPIESYHLILVVEDKPSLIGAKLPQSVPNAGVSIPLTLHMMYTPPIDTTAAY